MPVGSSPQPLSPLAHVIRKTVAYIKASHPRDDTAILTSVGGQDTGRFTHPPPSFVRKIVAYIEASHPRQRDDMAILTFVGGLDAGRFIPPPMLEKQLPTWTLSTPD